jgi:hypothetical protein
MNSIRLTISMAFVLAQYLNMAYREGIEPFMEMDAGWPRAKLADNTTAPLQVFCYASRPQIKRDANIRADVDNRGTKLINVSTLVREPSPTQKLNTS